MGVFSSFEYDVFVSYARDDNLYSDIFHFSDLLKRELERRVRNYDHKSPIRKVELFFDTRSMPMNGGIVDECGRAVASSAFFFGFVSETYLERPYCRQELEAFLRNSDHAKRQRLFLVLLDKGAEQRRGEWPDALPPDFRYVPLFDDEGRIPIHIVKDGTEAVDNPKVTKVIGQLAGAIFDRSVELGLTPSGRSPAQVSPALKKPRVAVGAVT
jgi:TIR domain